MLLGYVAYNFVMGAYSYWGPKAGYSIYQMVKLLYPFTLSHFIDLLFFLKSSFLIFFVLEFLVEIQHLLFEFKITNKILKFLFN